MTDDTAARFAADIEHHQMTVLRDDGLYRHVKFVHTVPNPETGKPERSSFYWFELVTWPGSLVINGDMGSFTFSRTEDMFGFFRLSGGRINPQYWAEKVPHGVRTKEFSPELFEQLVTEHVEDAAREIPGLAEDVKAEILDGEYSGYEDGARRLLDGYRYYLGSDTKPSFEFTDTWEWDLTDWSYQFLWCCYAIIWGIGRYDGTDTPLLASEHDRTPVSVTVTVGLQPGSPAETVPVAGGVL